MPSPALRAARAVRVLARRGIAAPCIALLAAASAAAQPQAAADFTIDDVLDVRNASVGAVSPDGRWVVVTYGALRDRIGTDNYRYGDPTYVAPSLAQVAVIDTRTGESRPLFADKRQVRAFEFSPDGSRLALMVRDGDRFDLAVWERERGRMRTLALPRGRVLDASAGLSWTPDGQKLLIQLRSAESHDAMRRRFEREVEGPIVVQSSEEPFLSWEEIRRLGNRRILAVYDVGSGNVSELTAETMAVQPALVAGGTAVRYNEDITKKTSYDEIFGTENRVVVQPLTGGEPRVLFDSIKGMSFVWSGDGRAYAYGKDGRIHFARLDGGEARQIAGEAQRRDSAAAPADSAARTAERERRARERFTPVRLNETGDVLIASNRDGLWFIDTGSGTRELFHRTRPEGAGGGTDTEEENDTLPRWSVVAWSKDGDDVYLNYASRTAWERGVYRYERSTKQLRELVKDGRSYGGLTLSDDGGTFILTVTEGNRPGDVYAADADLSNLRRLTDANPQLREKRLGTTELFDYLDVDGEKQYGVIYYPPDYEASRRYPTVFIVYETFFDDRFNSTVSLLNAHGYVVVQPSVRLEQGYPGEAWVKGVTTAANELVRRGIADADRLGVHGTSYGGYATNLLITQTDRFAAAINISGKVDMISFYTDSPRLGVRNIHAPEKSQDRIGATLWEQPQKYIAHSAIMFADRIDTPLLLMTGAQDHNVPERTTMEMYYALRRLGKDVEWVSYTDGGHGMPTTTVDEVVDYHRRILDWYEKHLKKPKGNGVAQN
jgi:dipeptidyl aminopeptidase/acylaminoacyl peptidase